MLRHTNSALARLGYGGRLDRLLLGGVRTMVLCKFGIPVGERPLVPPLNPESPFLSAVATAFLLYCTASAVSSQWSVLRALRRIWRS